MPRVCHRVWTCYKTLTFCSLLAGWRIPCACHTKQRFNVQKWRQHVVLCTFWLRNVLRATTAYTFSTSQLPKMFRGWRALYILTSKRVSCHNGVHFFDMSTSKSGPSMVCFAHVDLEICFAPQRRALFRHLNFQKVLRPWCALYILTSKRASRHKGMHFFRHINFQKWSAVDVFCTFWLENVLLATTACNFSSPIWPAGSAPATLASLLFDPPEPQIIGKKHGVSRLFCLSRTCIFFLWLFLLTLSLLISPLFSSLLFSSLLWLFPPLLFHLSISSEVWL